MFGRGLLGSLDDLAVRCAIVAIGLPALVFVVALARGHRFFVDQPGHPGQPLLAAALASYVVVPMLALAAAISGAVVALAASWAARPSALQVARSAFLVSAGVLAILMAVAYDGYLLPDVLG